MFFGDTDVEELFWEFLGEGGEAGAAGHGGGDGEYFGILFCEFEEGFAEDGFVFWGCVFGVFSVAGGDFERSCAVEFGGVIGGGVVAFALFGEDVEDDGLVGFFAEFEVLDEELLVVAVDGADVAEAKFFEEGRGDEEVLCFAFCLGAKFYDGVATRDFLEEGFEVFM